MWPRQIYMPSRVKAPVIEAIVHTPARFGVCNSSEVRITLVPAGQACRPNEGPRKVWKAIMYKIPAVWMRGGTSKCWVFEWDNLQVPGKSVDEVLLRLVGSPDNRQVDGVGGGTSTTSKAVILSRSLTDDADVDYTFAQVAIDEQKVDWGSNCGNCSAVVAP